MFAAVVVLFGALLLQGGQANRGGAEDGGVVATGSGSPDFLSKELRIPRRLAARGMAGSGSNSSEGIVAQELHTCREYGCVGYSPTHECQCNDLCKQYGNCCDDFEVRCVGGGQVPSCDGYGCIGYTPSHICQCNDLCQQYGNCCADYDETCADKMEIPTANPTPRPTSGTTPSPTPQAPRPTIPPTQAPPSPTPWPTPSPTRSPTELFRPQPVPTPPVPIPRPTPSPTPAAVTSPTTSPPAPAPLTTTSPDPAPQPPSSNGWPAGHPDPAKQYPQYPGFTLSLVEEFEEPLDLDNDPIWTWSDGGLGEGIVRFVQEGVQFEDGKMKIYARDDLDVPIQQCSHAESDVLPPKRLTSGELRTRYNQFRYGRYEVSMKAPSVQPGDTTINGNYIATMFVFRDAKFRHWREIDIEATGDSPQSVTTNVLHADNTAYWNPFIARAVEIQAPFNARDDFHTYAFEWLPGSVTWYIDGEEVRSHHCSDGVPVPDLSGKIMMNLWIFGGDGFGGKEGSNNRWPMHTEYDWIRFYRWDGEETYPCPGMSSSCLTEDDLFLTGNNPCDGIPQAGREGVCTASCMR